jgi:hypothetical protein
MPVCSLPARLRVDSAMTDTEFVLHRDEVGLIVRGVRSSFPSYVVTTDRQASPPHVAFVPRPS